MLRESANTTGNEYDLAAIVSASAQDSGVAHGRQLLRFVDAVLNGSETDLRLSRNDVHKAIGAAAFVDTCATVASFNAVVKIADGTGIPLEEAKAERTRDLRAELGIDALKS